MSITCKKLKKQNTFSTSQSNLMSVYRGNKKKMFKTIWQFQMGYKIRVEFRQFMILFRQIKLTFSDNKNDICRPWEFCQSLKKKVADLYVD